MNCCTVRRSQRCRTTRSRACHSRHLRPTGSITRALLHSAGTTRSYSRSCAQSTARTALSRSFTLTRTSTRGNRRCSVAHRASAQRSTMGRTFTGPLARDSSRMGAQLQVSSLIFPPSPHHHITSFPSLIWSMHANFWDPSDVLFLIAWRDTHDTLWSGGLRE